MYSHGFGTLFLAEAYGMTHRPEIREKLHKAVQLIIDTQNNEGGWRYQPVKHDADLSVTICQINALRAARNAGLFVPKETVAACIQYVKRSQNPDGGFRYMLRAAPARSPSAAGVVALQSAGEYDTERGSRRDRVFAPVHPRNQAGEPLQPLLLRALLRGPGHVDSGGEDWNEWYPAIRTSCSAPVGHRLLVRQHLQRIRHRHGPDHPADSEQLPADFPAMRGSHP